MEKNWVDFYHCMLIFITMILAGCATPFVGYGEKRLSREEFAHYVEYVFRFQNNITSEVMMLPKSESKDHANLLKAEQHMHDICAPLNAYASRESEGLRIGLFLRRRVERSVVDCERAARQVESLLKEL